jgi:DnaK suppressor protein
MKILPCVKYVGELMARLNPTQIDHLGKVLADRASALQVEIRAELAANSNYADIAGTVTDLGDAAVADLLSDIGNANVARDIAELRDIEAAKQRIGAGKYGRCPDCGKDIAYQRLIAHPTAKRCEPCQIRFEKTIAQPIIPKSL